MAYLNVKSRSLETKIVYYGAGLSGKTTNLEIVKKHSEEGRCGEMMSLNTAGDRTLFFDWVPFNMGKVNGCDVKMQLYTVPGQAKYAETRRRVLAGADGIVLVLDSQSSAVERNLEIMADLREQMAANHLKAENCPIVVQLNKRDLPNAMRVEDLVRELSLDRMITVEAVAATGQGVFETLREATKLVLAAVRRNAREDGASLSAGEASGLDGQTLYASLTEGQDVASLGLVDAGPPTRMEGSGPRSPTGMSPSGQVASSEPRSPREGSDAVASSGPFTPPPPAVAVAGPPAPASSATVTMPISPISPRPPSAVSPGSTPVSSASAGASGTAPVSAPTSAPLTSPSRAPQPPATSVPSNGRPGEPVPSVSAAGFGELLAGVRAMSLRLDALEPTLTRAMGSQNADLERRLALRVEQTVEQKVGAVARTVAGTVDSTDAQLNELASAISTLTIRAERAEKAAADANAVAVRLLSAVAGLTEEVRNRLAETNVETERRLVRASDETTRQAAEAEERTNKALANLREVIFKDATSLAERVNAEQKLAHKSLLEPFAAVRARLLDDAVLHAQRDDELRVLIASTRGELEARFTSSIAGLRDELGARVDGLATDLRESNRGLLDDRLGVLAADLVGRATTDRVALEKRLGQWMERLPDVGAMKLVVEAGVVKPLADIEQRLLTLSVSGAEGSQAVGVLKSDVAATLKDVRSLSASMVKATELQRQGVEEMARDLRQAEINLGQRIEAIPPDVARALATPLARTGDSMAALGANVAAGLSSVNEAVSGNERSLTKLREQLCDPTGKTLPKALEDVWTHTHNHFSTVEEALRRVGEDLHRASVDAKGKPWWKG
jgi:hypothetical protein